MLTLRWQIESRRLPWPVDHGHKNGINTAMQMIVLYRYQEHLLDFRAMIFYHLKIALYGPIYGRRFVSVVIIMHLYNTKKCQSLWNLCRWEITLQPRHKTSSSFSLYRVFGFERHHSTTVGRVEQAVELSIHSVYSHEASGTYKPISVCKWKIPPRVKPKQKIPEGFPRGCYFPH